MRRPDKIEFIKKKLLPLMTYLNTESTAEERFEWEDGDTTHKITKSFIGEEKLLEICASSYSLRGKKWCGLTSFVYKLPYEKGGGDFIDIDNWTFQII